MYVQEGYSLSCDALIKVIRSPRSNWKLMFQGKRPKTLFNETPRPYSPRMQLWVPRQIHHILKEYLGFRIKVLGDVSKRQRVRNCDLGLHGTTWRGSTSGLWPGGIFRVWMLIYGGSCPIWRFNPVAMLSTSSPLPTFSNIFSYTTFCPFGFMISFPTRSWTAHSALRTSLISPTRTRTPRSPWRRTPWSWPAPRSGLFPYGRSGSGSRAGEWWCCSRGHLGHLLVLIVEQVGRVVLPLVRVVVVSLSQLG